LKIWGGRGRTRIPPLGGSTWGGIRKKKKINAQSIAEKQKKQNTKKEPSTHKKQGTPKPLKSGFLRPKAKPPLSPKALGKNHQTWQTSFPLWRLRVEKGGQTGGVPHPPNNHCAKNWGFKKSRKNFATRGEKMRKRKEESESVNTRSWRKGATRGCDRRLCFYKGDPLSQQVGVWARPGHRQESKLCKILTREATKIKKTPRGTKPKPPKDQKRGCAERRDQRLRENPSVGGGGAGNRRGCREEKQ